MTFHKVGAVALAVISLLIGSLGSAQSEAATMVVATSDLRSTAADQPSSSYLQLSYDQGSLRVTLSSTATDGSPLLVERFALQGEGQADIGFQTVHVYASLSEVIDYYWAALTDLGFKGAIYKVDGNAYVYTFENGDGQLEAVFTWCEDDVTASLSWV